MTLTEKFTDIADGFMNLIRTRASVNLDNLTEVGKARITSVSGGIPKTTMSNVILSATNQTSSIADDVLTISGTFIAYSPEGKNSDNSLNSTEVEITLEDQTIDLTDLDGTYAVMVSRTGTVTANPYVVSYSTPEDAIDNRIWYDLANNRLRLYDTEYSIFQGFKLGTLTVKAGKDPDFQFHGACQIVDGATLLDEIELAKTPVGTVIAYMGTDIPEGYLLMDGRLLSRTTYSRLFSVIGTTQGEGDGSTTFQIADMTDGRYLMGSTVAGSRASKAHRTVRI